MSSTTAPVDLKSTLKAMKAHMDNAAYRQAIDVGSSCLSSLPSSSSSDSKLRSLIYTLHAFLGLAQYHEKNLLESEGSYTKAIDIDPEQFPAYKGLYDVYMMKGGGGTMMTTKLRSVLTKLIQLAPPNLKKLTYTLQIIRIEVEEMTTTTEIAAIENLRDRVDGVLKDPLLASAEPIERSKLTLESHTLLALLFDLNEQSLRSKELKVRLDRQLTKYRTERLQADKLRQQQLSSKAGAIAAAVQHAKGGPTIATQAEEEAEIIRKVTLKLDKDLLETSSEKVRQTFEHVLTIPGGESKIERNHILIREKLLAIRLQRAHVLGEWMASTSDVSREVEELADSIWRDSQHLTFPSAMACRILVGLRWMFGGVRGAAVDVREAALERQRFFESAVTVLTSNDASSEEQSYGWMAYHALATSIISTEVNTTIELPAHVLSSIPITNGTHATASVFEVAEAIFKNVTPANATSSSASTSSDSLSISSSVVTAAATSAPSSSLVSPSLSLLPSSSPLCPSYLTSISLGFALQRFGETRHKECLATLQQALKCLQVHKKLYPHDSRSLQSTIDLELTLASTYSFKILDERIFEKGSNIFQTQLISLMKVSYDMLDRFQYDALIRTLEGLTRCALVKVPFDLMKAQQYLDQLSKLLPEDAWTHGQIGWIALQRAKEMRQQKGDGGDADGSIRHMLDGALASIIKARSIAVEDPQHALRHGLILMELNGGERDLTRDAIDALRDAERFATNQLNTHTAAASPSSSSSSSAAPTSSVAVSSLRTLLAESLACQGVVSTVDAKDQTRLYMSALKFDPSNERAGRALVQRWLNSDDSSVSSTVRVDAVRQLSLAAVNANPRCLWGWARLGTCQATLKSHGPAISSFQNALRILATGGGNESGANAIRASDIWQQLAECYSHIGQFIAAYKAIARAVECFDEEEPKSSIGAVASSSSSSRPSFGRQVLLTQLAQSQLNLSSMTDAIRTLESAIGTDASASTNDIFPPALKLLSHSLYAYAKELVHGGAYEAASIYLDRSIETSKRCIKLVQDSISCEIRSYVTLWKLIGDAYTLYHSLPTDKDAVVSPSENLPLAESRKMSYLTHASRAYAKAIHLKPTTSEHWYDASLTQYRLALALHAPAGSTSTDTPQPTTNAAGTKTSPILDTPTIHPTEALYRARALSMVKGALLLAPSNVVYWHLLGVVDVRPLVRQHALAHAVTTLPTDATGWANLGCFYLQQSHVASTSAPSAGAVDGSGSAGGAGGIDLPSDRSVLLGLSRHALEVSQTLDPANPTLWSAQGLFNQAVGSMEAYVQASACFARSIELFPTQVARFGLAYTAYCIGDIQTALFSIRKFLDQYPSHCTSWNLCGLILEHAALDSSHETIDGGRPLQLEARQAFINAERLLREDTRLDRQRQSELIRMVRVNRARVCVTCGAFEESITAYQQLIQEAAQQAQSGEVPSSQVLASALTLHVDLSSAYTRAGMLVDAINVLSTGVAIAGQQVESIVEVEPSNETYHNVRQQRSELIKTRRELLLKQAQLYAMNRQYDESKQFLQQSVSESPDYPHPEHYFSTMTALYALSLQQHDLGTASYAVTMLGQCIAGMVASPDHSADAVMTNMLGTYYRIQAQMAILQKEDTKARRFYQKLIHLNPTKLESWNEFHRTLLGQSSTTAAAGAAAPVTAHSTDTILATSTLVDLPTDFVQDRRSVVDVCDKLIVQAGVLLEHGRSGMAILGRTQSSSASSKDDDSNSAALWKAQAAAEENDDLEFQDDAQNVNVRAKGAGREGPLLLAGVETTNNQIDNLHSARISASLIHIAPSNLAGWALHASSAYSHALTASLQSSSDVCRPLFTKTIRLLQLYTRLVTDELQRATTSGQQKNIRGLTLSLYECQCLLVDSYLRRADHECFDLEQAEQLLNSICQQQQQSPTTFPLSNTIVSTLLARCSLARGDLSAGIAHLRRALETTPLQIELWEEMADAYGRNGATQAQEACLQAAITLLKAEPVTTTIHTYLHRLYLRVAHLAYSQNRSSVGIDACESAVRTTGSVGSSSATGFYLLGLCHAAIGHPDQALRQFQHALNLTLSNTVDHYHTSPLMAAAKNLPITGLKFAMALLFMRSSTGSSSSNSNDSNLLTEARELLEEELQTGVVAPQIFFQLANIASKVR